MKIHGWLAGSVGCEYYRIKLPLDQLAEHDVSYSDEIDEDIANGSLDVLVGQRVCLPEPSITWQKMARDGHTKMVYELDDDLTDIDHWNPAGQGYRHFREQIQANIECSDLVIVSTEPLADVVSKWNRNVTVIPNYVPGWLLEHEHETPKRLTVGWAGSQSHSADFAECSSYVQRAVRRARAEFHCIGANYVEGWDHARHTPWFANTEDYLRNVDFHIGIAPLRPSMFNRSKSAIKLLELSALGIPAVVSNVGPYERAIQGGSPSYGVRQPHEWATALRAILEDDDMRLELGEQARAWASTQTIEGNAWRWKEALSEPRRHSSVGNRPRAA